MQKAKSIISENKTKNYFIWFEDSDYPNNAPYNPEENYAEYPFEFIENGKQYRNDVYRMVRELFINCKMDVENYNSEGWNPLGMYIKPGNTVLIKPNLVRHDNPAEVDVRKKFDCMITHPSVVRCLFDYVYIALKGKGKIIIADAPVQGCKFDILLQKSGYGDLFHEILNKGSDELIIDVADLRDTILEVSDGNQRQRENSNRKYGGRVIDLGSDSKFDKVEKKQKLRITNYASRDTVLHHIKGTNEYCVSEALLEADVIINIPKPKTHRIAGYTAALKNMIGINTRKEYLPHHMKGEKGKFGDEYIGTYGVLKWLNSTGNDIKNFMLKHQFDILTDVFDRMCRVLGRKLDKLEVDRKKFGMWYGNDTIWRTILDVNKIVYFANKEGEVCTEEQRKVLHFGDMIVCGEKEGPLRPTYKKVGGILFSDNPIYFDYCVVKLMGFDYRKLPTLLNAMNDAGIDAESIRKIRLCSNNKMFNKAVYELEQAFCFEPSSGWKGFL